MRIVLPDIEEKPEFQKSQQRKTQRENKGKTRTYSASQETENSIEASGVGSYSVEFAVENENLSNEAAREITTELMNTIKEKVLKLNPEFVGHIKLFLDKGSETVTQSVAIYYEEPQEQIIKSEEGAVPAFKILSAVTNVNKEALKDAVDSSVQEVLEKKGIRIHKPEHSHEQEHQEHTNAENSETFEQDEND